eukprot:scaffold13985_cov86-Skeletonema_dohrnii-CCMP3373.AAC.1
MALQIQTQPQMREERPISTLDAPSSVDDMQYTTEDAKGPWLPSCKSNCQGFIGGALIRRDHGYRDASPIAKVSPAVHWYYDM